MSLQDKLRVVRTPDRISLQPNRRLAAVLKLYALVAVALGLFLAIFYAWLGEGVIVICAALLIYLVIRGLTDYLFGYNVRYEFDKIANAVYRENPPFGKKQIMRLDEMVIITGSASGDWYYAIGKKKQQLVKNYRISPFFGSAGVYKLMITEFEEDILVHIIALLPGSAH